VRFFPDNRNGVEMLCNAGLMLPFFFAFFSPDCHWAIGALALPSRVVAFLSRHLASNLKFHGSWLLLIDSDYPWLLPLTLCPFALFNYALSNSPSCLSFL
jgi:hypothetical protein